MRRKKPQPCSKGSFLSLVAPSSAVNSDWLIQGERKLERGGYHLQYTRQVFAAEKFWAGKDEDRAEDFLEAIESRETSAIWCARGGYGATRILDILDAAKAAARARAWPKLLIGYSDATALHSYFWKFARLPGLHAPLMATPSWLKLPKKSCESLYACLRGEMGLGLKSFSRTWKTKHLLKPVEAEGIILGGNLSVLASLVGTPWEPDLKGAILCLEDCNEAPYRIDRMLVQLHAAGLFSDIRGVVVGDLSEGVPAEVRKQHSWKDVIIDQFDGLGIPVLIQAPIGHGKRCEWLPLGIQGRITESGHLEYLEQLVAPRGAENE